MMAIEALWLPFWRSPRRWTDVHAHVWIRGRRCPPSRAKPALEDVEKWAEQ